MTGRSGNGTTSTGVRRDLTRGRSGVTGGSAGWRGSESGRRPGAGIAAGECRTAHGRDVRDADYVSGRNPSRHGDDDRRALQARRSARVKTRVLMVVPVPRRREDGDVLMRIDDRVMRIVLALVLMRHAVRQRLAGDGEGGEREQRGNGQAGE